MRTQVLAALCSLLLPLQPVVARASTTGVPGARSIDSLIIAAQHGSVVRFTGKFSPIPISLLATTRVPAVLLESQRQSIGDRLTELGTREAQAFDMVSQLTAEDLSVLANNPRMLQRAGDIVLIVVVVLIVGGIVLLALAADSSTVIISS